MRFGLEAKAVRSRIQRLFDPVLGSLFIAVFSALCTIAIVAAVGGYALLSYGLSTYVEQDVRNTLIMEANLFEGVLRVPGGLDVIQQAINAQDSSQLTRLTIIAADGTVLAESSPAEAATMDSHDLRPEIVKARTLGSAFYQRSSATLGVGMLYLARRVELGDSIVFLRLGVSMDHLGARSNELRSWLILGTIVVVILAMFIASALARSLVRPILEMTAVADALAHGSLHARVEKLERNELGILGGAINSLAESVESNIAKRMHMEKIRSEFTSNVSHELKTPLTSIRGYVELLQSDAGDDKSIRARTLAIVERNVSRIIAIISDLLSLAELEAKERPLQLEPIELIPLLKDSLNQFQELMDQKKIRCTLDVPVQLTVLGERKAMRHVLDNLMQNAVNYTSEGGAIRIGASSQGANVEITIEDSGIGIPEHEIPRIFERFYRVDKARSRELGGTGLGLSIVKHLVSHLKGSIAVRSEVGKGSAFSVTLLSAAMDTAL